MKSFLTKVRSATNAMGKEPYDDNKTREAVSKATEKALELYDKLRKTKDYK